MKANTILYVFGFLGVTGIVAFLIKRQYDKKRYIQAKAQEMKDSLLELAKELGISVEELKAKSLEEIEELKEKYENWGLNVLYGAKVRGISFEEQCIRDAIWLWNNQRY